MEKEVYVPLVIAAQKGEDQAINKLFIEIYNDIYYFALKTVKDAELAADITQETLIEVFNKIGDLKEPVAFPAWCRQIAYFQCTRYFRKKNDVLVDEDEDGASIFDTIQEESAEFIPDESLDQKDFKQIIIAFIDTLSEEQRSAVMMYYFDEMSVSEIAQIQGVSEGTVKSRLNYARKAIKAMVEDYEKKNDTKLHAIAFFPFFKWLFAPDKAGVKTPPMAMQKAANAVKSASTSTIATTGAASTTASVATSAKATGFGVGAKIAAASVAAALVVGASAAVPIIEKDGERVSVLKAVFSESNDDDDSDNEDSNKKYQLVIHEGGIYYTHDEELGEEVKLVGDGKIKFPDQPKEGDVYVYGDYQYSYSTDRFHLYGHEYCEGSGWNVGVIDNSQTTYGPILDSIGKTPVTLMIHTFNGCYSMTQAPEIPDTITCMANAFTQCTSLINPPTIPNGVIDLNSTFIDCDNLEQAPHIPESVKLMEMTFARSFLSWGSKLHDTTVVVDANPEYFDDCFSQIRNITVTGKTSLKEELEATSSKGGTLY